MSSLDGKLESVVVLETHSVNMSLYRRLDAPPYNTHFMTHLCSEARNLFLSFF